MPGPDSLTRDIFQSPECSHHRTSSHYYYYSYLHNQPQYYIMPSVFYMLSRAMAVVYQHQGLHNAHRHRTPRCLGKVAGALQWRPRGSMGCTPCPPRLQYRQGDHNSQSVSGIDNPVCVCVCVCLITTDTLSNQQHCIH